MDSHLASSVDTILVECGVGTILVECGVSGMADTFRRMRSMVVAVSKLLADIHIAPHVTRTAHKSEAGIQVYTFDDRKGEIHVVCGVLRNSTAAVGQEVVDILREHAKIHEV